MKYWDFKERKATDNLFGCDIKVEPYATLWLKEKVSFQSQKECIEALREKYNFIINYFKEGNKLPVVVNDCPLCWFTDTQCVDCVWDKYIEKKGFKTVGCPCVVFSEEILEEDGYFDYFETFDYEKCFEHLERLDEFEKILLEEENDKES